MPNYMLLLYAGDADRAETARRDADLPEWGRLMEEFAASGKLAGTGRLRPSQSATTVRVRDHETELTDGPFAVTKEILGGYFILDCEDLDEATAAAAKLPIARYGSVEVRPLMTNEEMMQRSEEAAATEA
jgi:hypothetical protein